MRGRYPELACLVNLPPGTVLDSEIVVLENGKPNFNRLMQRDHISDAKRVAMLAERIPATLMAFDLLYDGGKDVMRQPLTERRARLAELIAKLNNQHVIVPSYVIGHGKQYFAGTEQLALEGVMAKRLAGRYQPGQRSEHWVKIKVARVDPFHIIGFTQRDTQPFISALIIAMRQGRRWMLKGKVGAGFTEHQRGEFYQALADAPPLTQPPAGGPADAQWRHSGLTCNVRYFEKTVTGQLRGPVFEGLVQSGGDD
jgi:bifunctional non-homologous end joining protein LigD/DNA ligase-1